MEPSKHIPPLSAIPVVGKNQCSYCAKTFRDAGKLSRHVKEQHSGPVVKHQCPSCDKSYKRPELLRNHISGAHEKSNGRWCELCQKNFLTLQKYQVHMEHVHENRHKFQCKVCKAMFKYESTMLIHQSKHTGSGYECSECCKNFANKFGLDKHNEMVHNSKVSKDKDVPMVAYAAINVEKGKKSTPRDLKFVYNEMQCNECGLWCMNQMQLLTHTQNVHEEGYHRTAVCNICGKSMSKARLNRHLKEVHKMEPGVKEKEVDNSGIPEARNANGVFECMHCNVTCLKRSSLFSHIAHIHLKDKRNLRCNWCDVKIDYGRTMVRHIKRKHPAQVSKALLEDFMAQGEAERLRRIAVIKKGGYEIIDIDDSKHIQCHHCGKKFGNDARLKRHIRSVHENKYHYKCKECDQVFSEYPGLMAHMKQSHSNVDLSDFRPRKVVDKGMPKKDNNLFRFQCKECDKTFEHGNNAKKHVIYNHLKDCKHLQCKFCDIQTKMTQPMFHHIEAKHPDQLTERLRQSYRIEYAAKSKQILQLIRQKGYIIDRGNLMGNVKRPVQDRVRCEECGKMLAGKRSLKGHIKRFHQSDTDGDDDEDCESIGNDIEPDPFVNESDPDSFVNESDPDAFVNDIDPDTFANENVSDCSMEEEEQRRQSSCSETKSGLMDIDTKPEGIVGKDTSDKLCWTCGKTFTRVHCRLRLHNFRVEKAYQCLQCDICFGPRGMLRTHVETVRLLRIHICDVCCKLFKTKADLSYHESHAHDVSSKTKTRSVIWNKMFRAEL